MGFKAERNDSPVVYICGLPCRVGDVEPLTGPIFSVHPLIPIKRRFIRSAVSRIVSE